MITEIIELNNNKIFKIMKTFFYFTPIAIIVFQFLKNYYPDLDFYFSSDISTINVKYSIVYFFMFSILSFFFLFLEKIILPVFILPKVPQIKIIKEYLIEKVNKKFTDLGTENPYETSQKSSKIEIYELLCSVFVTCLLWTFIIKSWFAIVLVLLITTLSIFMASIINTMIEK